MEKASLSVGQHMELAKEREQTLRERDALLKHLCHELETEKMLSFNVEDLSEHAISQYDSTIQNAEALKTQRLRTIDQLSGEIRVLWDELCTDPADYSRCPVQCAVANVQPLLASQTHINILEHAKLQLQHVKVERTSQFAAYARDIKGLWNQLEVSDEDRRAFITNNNRLGMENLHEVCVCVSLSHELSGVAVTLALAHFRVSFRGCAIHYSSLVERVSVAPLMQLLFFFPSSFCASFVLLCCLLLCF
jgi:Microtubule associated protein (MAP65/ASE1 family)